MNACMHMGRKKKAPLAYKLYPMETQSPCMWLEHCGMYVVYTHIYPDLFLGIGARQFDTIADSYTMYVAELNCSYCYNVAIHGMVWSHAPGLV